MEIARNFFFLIIPACCSWYKHLGFCLWGSGGLPTIRIMKLREIVILFMDKILKAVEIYQVPAI